MIMRVKKELNEKKREKTFALMSTPFSKQQQHETTLKCFSIRFKFLERDEL